MSYDVYLQKDNHTVEVDRHKEGGTYAIGGITKAHLNVTYNYVKAFGYSLFDFDGKVAKDLIPFLESEVKRLGTEQDEDYWKPTNGNAGYALSILLRWAKQYPDAVFEVR